MIITDHLIHFFKLLILIFVWCNKLNEKYIIEYIMKFIKNIIKRIIFIVDNKKVLGRWNIEQCEKKIDIKIDL